MHSNIGIGALVIGAILILAALLSGQFRVFRDRLPTAVGRWSRVLMGLLGAGLIVWVLAIPLPIDPMQSAHSAVLACHEPAAPAVPDGATAVIGQMTAARNAYQAYDAAVTGYVQCLDSTLDPVTKQVTGSASAADLEKLRVFQIEVHNAAVEREQAAVDRFNVQLRVYKAKHT